MSRLTNWLLSVFLSPVGLLVLGALDSSVFVSTPFALDAAVVVLVAQHRDQFWLFPLLATIGSIAGASVTFWMGLKIGAAGLHHHIPIQRLERTLARVRDTSSIALAALDLLPPPFPFTPVILVAGALELSASRFLIALTFIKLVRFGGEAALALVYGPQILSWKDSPIVRTIGESLVMLVVALAIYSAFKLLGSSRRRRAEQQRRASA
jgi:membrane protein YqaA with SNARE-associated domain